MGKFNEVSLVVPLYGNFDITRAQIVIDAIKLQKGVDTEIVVSEQGIAPRLQQIPEVTHTFKYHKPSDELSDFNPGNVRNEPITR